MIPEEYRKYEKTVSIACVNFATVWGDKAANLKKMKAFINKAADSGNNMVLFPELALTGYECSDDIGEDGCSMHRELAETIPGPATEEIAQLAKDRNVYVVFGLPEIAPDNPKHRHISAAVVGPEGILGVYRKIHLMASPTTERKCFVPGKSLPVFETRFGYIGVQICYDFWSFPEQSRILMLKGARIILNAAASPAGAGKVDFMVQQTCARAVENMVYCASANLTGRDRTAEFYGHGTIAGRGWKITQVYAEGGPEEGIVSATLNLEQLYQLRKSHALEKAEGAELIMAELAEIVRRQRT